MKQDKNEKLKKLDMLVPLKYGFQLTTKYIASSISDVT